jgi:hypothetical protein
MMPYPKPCDKGASKVTDPSDMVIGVGSI